MPAGGALQVRCIGVLTDLRWFSRTTSCSFHLRGSGCGLSSLLTNTLGFERRARFCGDLISSCSLSSIFSSSLGSWYFTGEELADAAALDDLVTRVRFAATRESDAEAAAAAPTGSYMVTRLLNSDLTPPRTLGDILSQLIAGRTSRSRSQLLAFWVGCSV